MADEIGPRLIDEQGLNITPEPKNSLPLDRNASVSSGEATLHSPADRESVSAGPSPVENLLAATAGLISQYSFMIVAIWIGVVAISMAGFSRQKPLWADEVLFRWIVTLPSIGQIWHSLTLGINTDPPLDHFLTHGLTTFFGSSALVVRLTSIAGISVMLACLFLTLRKYIGSLYALLGVLLPFCTMLVDYGYEARPYGLMYGCFGLAIFCWVKTGEDEASGSVWNFTLFLSLAAALGCHFYSVFALPAFCLGEAVRTQRRGRIHWPTVAALLGASATVLLYLPIIVGARKFSGAYFEKPSLTSIPSMLIRSLDQLVIPLFAFLAFVALFATLGVHFPREEKLDESPRFRELTALGLGFLLIPLLAWGAGLLVLKAFTARYVLHGLFGVFLLLPLFAGRIFRLDRTLGLALLVACGLPALFFAEQGGKRLLKPSNPNADLAQLAAALPALKGDIAVSDPHLLLELLNYSPALKSKCIYLWDNKNELAFTSQDGFSHLAGSAANLGFFRAQAWSDYPDRDRAFLFLTTPDSESDGLGWLRADLEAEHRYGQVVAAPAKYRIVQANPL
jgi:hypothetical protein